MTSYRGFQKFLKKIQVLCVRGHAQGCRTYYKGSVVLEELPDVLEKFPEVLEKIPWVIKEVSWGLSEVTEIPKRFQGARRSN